VSAGSVDVVGFRLRRAAWGRRENDQLILGVDHRQLDEIEQKRDGGRLTFIFTIGGLLHHRGMVVPLRPNNHTLMYEVGASTWVELLAQLGYGTYLTIEVPFTSADGLTGPVQQAAQALQEAMDAFRRGDYEEAVADCRPGLDALRDADKGKFSAKWLDQSANREERFSWVQRSLLSVAHLAHHPNDPAVTGEEAASEATRPSRADAEAVISMLASLVRWRKDRS
jgi:hypothetical protein